MTHKPFNRSADPKISYPKISAKFLSSVMLHHMLHITFWQIVLPEVVTKTTQEDRLIHREHSSNKKYPWFKCVLKNVRRTGFSYWFLQSLNNTVHKTKLRINYVYASNPVTWFPFAFPKFIRIVANFFNHPCIGNIDNSELSTNKS